MKKQNIMCAAFVGNIIFSHEALQVIISLGVTIDGVIISHT
jgi:hypothetical protein